MHDERTSWEVLPISQESESMKVPAEVTSAVSLVVCASRKQFQDQQSFRGRAESCEGRTMVAVRMRMQINRTIPTRIWSSRRTAPSKSRMLEASESRSRWISLKDAEQRSHQSFGT